MKKTPVWLTVAFALAFPVSLLAQATPGKSVVIERVIVKVNGEIFTQSQLTQRQIDAIREKNPQIQNTRTLDDAALRGLVEEVTPGILVESVNELLLVQRGRELGGKLTDEQFKEAVERLKTQNKLDDEGLKKAMEQEGVSLDELRGNFERAQLVQTTQYEEIFKKMNLTDEEIRQYYASHKEEFLTPATVTLREILVLVPTQTRNGQDMFLQGDDDAAKAKVEGFRARILAGEDFAAIATASSEAATKSNGGLIGSVEVANLNDSLAAVLEKMQPGQVTEPVRIPRGYQIFKLESRSAPELVPIERVRPQIEQKIRTARLGGETERLLRRLRQQSVIEWKDETLRRLYENAVSQKAAAK